MELSLNYSLHTFGEITGKSDLQPGFFSFNVDIPPKRVLRAAGVRRNLTCLSQQLSCQRAKSFAWAEPQRKGAGMGTHTGSGTAVGPPPGRESHSDFFLLLHCSTRQVAFGFSK